MCTAQNERILMSNNGHNYYKLTCIRQTYSGVPVTSLMVTIGRKYGMYERLTPRGI